MKIQRETATKTVQEVEVTLPYFCKKADNKFIAVLTESDALFVEFIGFSNLAPNVRIKHQNFDSSDLGEPITQAEFESIYIKANDYLSEQFESLRDVKSGTTVDDVLKNMDA